MKQVLMAFALLFVFSDIMAAQSLQNEVGELEFEFIAPEGEEEWVESFNWQVMTCIEVWDIRSGDDRLVGYEIHYIFVSEDNPLLELMAADVNDEDVLPEPAIYGFDLWMSRTEYEQRLATTGCEAQAGY